MSTPPLLSALDSHELIALFRALLEAKFWPEIPDMDLPGSRFVVAMIERVFEAQRDVALASGNPAMLAKLDAWQRVEGNPLFVAATRERLKECSTHDWLQWSREERLRAFFASLRSRLLLNLEHRLSTPLQLPSEHEQHSLGPDGSPSKRLLSGNLVVSHIGSEDRSRRVPAKRRSGSPLLIPR